MATAVTVRAMAGTIPATFRIAIPVTVPISGIARSRITVGPGTDTGIIITAASLTRWGMHSLHTGIIILTM